MTCSEIRKKLPAFLDGEVSEKEKRLISEHLESCGGCRKELEKLTQISDILDVMDEVHVLPFFMTRLKQRIADQRAQRRAYVPFIEWIRHAFVPVAVTALIFVCFLVGSNLGKVLHQERVESMVASKTETIDALGVTSLADFPEGSLGWAYNSLLAGGE
jgi:predicted anti-sigma-YlaC factor YlaD